MAGDPTTTTTWQWKAKKNLEKAEKAGVKKFNDEFKASGNLKKAITIHLQNRPKEQEERFLKDFVDNVKNKLGLENNIPIETDSIFNEYQDNVLKILEEYDENLNKAAEDTNELYSHEEAFPNKQVEVRTKHFLKASVDEANKLKKAIEEENNNLKIKLKSKLENQEILEQEFDTLQKKLTNQLNTLATERAETGGENLLNSYRDLTKDKRQAVIELTGFNPQNDAVIQSLAGSEIKWNKEEKKFTFKVDFKLGNDGSAKLMHAKRFKNNLYHTMMMRNSGDPRRPININLNFPGVSALQNENLKSEAEEIIKELITEKGFTNVYFNGKRVDNPDLSSALAEGEHTTTLKMS